MKVLMLTVNPFAMNSYIYYDEKTGDGIIIDPAAYSQEDKDLIRDAVKKNNINIKYIINTHGHIDHILGNDFAKDLFKVPILMHKDDEFMLANVPAQGRVYGVELPLPPPVDEYLTEDSVIRLPGSEMKIIHTPGHSPGSVCIIDDENKTVFCGDLIFKDSVGRTDLPGGDFNVLLDSIFSKLFKNTKDDYTLYPGHMEITNVRDEKDHNPFLNKKN